MPIRGSASSRNSSGGSPRESFVSFHVGYGAAIAVLLTAIVLVVAVFYLRAMFRRVEVY